MGSHPDRTGTAPQQLRHGLGVQPCDHAQHDHLGLKRRQGGYGFDVVAAIAGAGNWGVDGDARGRIASARLGW